MFKCLRAKIDEDNSATFGFRNMDQLKSKIFINSSLDESQVAVSSYAITYRMERTQNTSENIDLS